MREIPFTAEKLITALLNLPEEYKLCLLDSGGVFNLGSRLLIAGFSPLETLEINEADAEKSLEILNEKLSHRNRAAILSMGYEFGLKLNRIAPRPKEFDSAREPDFYLAVFDFYIVHDYQNQKTFLTGNEKRFTEVEKTLLKFAEKSLPTDIKTPSARPKVSSNFTRRQYLAAVEEIQERIRAGDTYQTNLTQQLTVELPENLTSETIFLSLRRSHPAAFSAFLRRKNDAVVSASPERFFKVERAGAVQNAASVQSAQCPVHSVFSEKQESEPRVISVSPIKGTRPRGRNAAEDLKLRDELLASAKDRAENVMIVDLLRNDIGRICEYGTVAVENLCDLETHPTLFHLVSTISGNLRENVSLPDILRALFPCGSITGAPKISTMRIIDELETNSRGLSMGAVGYIGFDGAMDFSVAIRTMVVRDQKAVFNVGGGIVIDSVSADEHAETLVKAQALLRVLGIDSAAIDFQS